MRQMYQIQGLTDESRVIQDAVEKSRGDSRNEPERVYLHYHPADIACPGKKHELYQHGEVVDA